MLQRAKNSHEKTVFLCLFLRRAALEFEKHEYCKKICEYSKTIHSDSALNLRFFVFLFKFLCFDYQKYNDRRQDKVWKMW